MFHYFTIPKVHLITERISIRLVSKQDALQLAEYYEVNRFFLSPWEPLRANDYYSAAGWKIHLEMIQELHKEGRAFYFALFEHDTQNIMGVMNYTHVLRGAFHACYLGYSLAKRYQGQGLMFEALSASIDYMFKVQKLHRIMANYMPDNIRSGNLLVRLGFKQEGYAKDYLLINGVWRDHILTALTNVGW